ncbi:MAG: hypothetical protein H7138_15740, partial [Myxococcales bacterium]|nr:hypothetical protein [Myxococcales bacterium]
MAKKQTRRSISVSRTTYERLKAFCETNNISMSQLVETRVNDFLGGDAPAPTPSHIGTNAGAGMMMSSPAPRPIAPRPMMQSAPARPFEVRPIEHRPIEHRPTHTTQSAPVAPIAAPVA